MPLGMTILFIAEKWNSLKQAMPLALMSGTIIFLITGTIVFLINGTIIFLIPSRYFPQQLNLRKVDFTWYVLTFFFFFLAQTLYEMINLLFDEQST